MRSALFYWWRSKCGGTDVAMMERLKELEGENRRLKKRYAEERLNAEISAQAMQKVVAPSCWRNIAHWAVQQKAVSIG